jgi:peptidoglycan hydrolase CwlO-like protein
MGLGSTAKKLQRTVDAVEDLYSKVNDLRERMVSTEKTVNDTNDRVAVLETELAEQRAVLDALADEQGVDVDAAAASAGDGGDAADAESKQSADEAAASTDGND